MEDKEKLVEEPTKKDVIGKIHSFESMGALDGPGLRYVAFMQGCPLRCAYCHNPDTWDFDKGEEYTPKALFRQIYRMNPYFASSGGGVTVSGGEPLMQADFVAELFSILRATGIHTALDTSGIISDERAVKVLEKTDLALVDLKFSNTADYKKYANADFEEVKKFLKLTEKMQVPIWIRHVVVPNLTDNIISMREIKRLAEQYSNLEKIEWLPFHNMCLEKYEELGVDFPLKNTEPMDKDKLNRLISEL